MKNVLDSIKVEVPFIRKNDFPKFIFQTWTEEPTEGQRVEVDYGYEKNNNVWWENGRFVNVFGFELHNIKGWRPYHIK